MSAHAKYSPSDADRWMLCAAALVEFPKVDGTDTVYSLEGTNAHQLLEDCLLEGTDATSYVGTRLFDEPTGEFAGEPKLDPQVSQDMADHIQTVQDYIYDRYNNAYPDDEPELWTEAKVEIVPDLCGGTMDVALWWPKAQVLEVIDLKYGQGVIVDPDGHQLKLYAVGVILKRKLKPKKVLMTVAQPRGFSSAGPIRTEELHNHDAAYANVLNRVHYLENLPAEGRDYEPSDKGCMWCPGRNTCKGRDAVLFEKGKEMFEDLDPVKGTTELTDKVQWLVENGDALVDEVNAAKSMMLQRVLREGPSYGHKAIMGKANRIWSGSPEEIEKTLREDFKLRAMDITVPKLLGIPAIEKAVKKLKPKRVNDLQELIVKPQGAPKLVHENAAGKPIVENAESMFEEVDASDSEETLEFL